MITRLTVTGADDSIKPEELAALSFEYPFLEFGILFSPKHYGDFRFPSENWLHELTKVFYHSRNELQHELQLSAHLCGRYVRNFLTGQRDIELFLEQRQWDMFSRVQLNTHGQRHNYDYTMLRLMSTAKEYIFQYDDVNTGPLEIALDEGFNCVALFDLSHGAGLLPSQWPELLPDIKCGYAGGLSPQNMPAQIQLIEEKAGDREIWIDLETHVRSLDDAVFDLFKVRQCCEIIKKHISTYQQV